MTNTRSFWMWCGPSDSASRKISGSPTLASGTVQMRCGLERGKVRRYQVKGDSVLQNMG